MTAPGGKRRTPKEQVLARWPNADCLEVSGCSFAVFKNGVLWSADLLALAHSKRGAWSDAARRLKAPK